MCLWMRVHLRGPVESVLLRWASWCVEKETPASAHHSRSHLPMKRGSYW